MALLMLLLSKELIISNGLKPGSSNINTHSSFIERNSKLTFSLHRYDVNIAYTLFNYIEASTLFNLNNITPISSMEKFYDANNAQIKISFGYKNFKTAILKNKLDEGGIISFMDTSNTFEAYRSIKENKFEYAFTYIMKYSKLIFEYTPDINIGFRVMLDKKLKLNIFVLNINRFNNIFDNIIFGISWNT